MANGRAPCAVDPGDAVAGIITTDGSFDWPDGSAGFSCIDAEELLWAADLGCTPLLAAAGGLVLLVAAPTTALITFCVTPEPFMAISALGEISKLAGVACLTGDI